MIEKYTASILMILILINSIGCYSYSQIKKEDIQEIEHEDEVKITTLEEKVYLLTEVEIQGDIVRGKSLNIYPKDVVEIPVEEIAKLEVEKSDSIFVLIIVAIVVIAIVNTDWDFSLGPGN